MKILLNKGTSFQLAKVKEAISKQAVTWLSSLSDEEAGRLACLLIPWNITAYEVCSNGLSTVKNSVKSYLKSSAGASVTRGLSRLTTKDYAFLHPVNFFGVKCEDTSKAFAELGSMGIVFGLLGMDLTYDLIEDGAPGTLSFVPARSAAVGPWYRWHFNFKSIRTATAFNVEAEDITDGLAYRLVKKVLKPLTNAVKREYAECSDSAIVSLSCGLRGMADAVSTSKIPADDIPDVYKGYCTAFDAFFFKKKDEKQFLATTVFSVGTFLLGADVKSCLTDTGELRFWRLDDYRMLEPSTQIGRYHTCIFFAHLIGLGSITRLDHSYNAMVVKTKEVSFMELVAYVFDKLHNKMKLVDPYDGWRGGVDWTMSIEHRKQGAVTTSLIANVLPTRGFITLNAKGGAFADKCKEYLSKYATIEDEDNLKVTTKVKWLETSNTFTCSFEKEDESPSETTKSLISLADPAAGLRFYKITIKKEA